MTFKFELICEREDIGQNFIDLYRSSSYNVHVVFSSVNSDNISSSAIEASKVVAEKVSLGFRFDYEGEDSVNHITEVNGYFVAKKISDEDLKKFLEGVVIGRYPHFISHINENPNYLGEFTSYSRDIIDVEPEQFLVVLSHFLPIDLVQKPKEGADNLASFTYIVFESSLREATEQITRFFTRYIRYLGPLRVEPSITQGKFAPTSNLDDVGFKGEYADIVYHFNQSADIEYYNPYSRRIEQTTLQEALDNWVQFLGVAKQIRTEWSKPSGATWKVVLKEGQKARTLPEVGVGVSQILPILVMGLLSPSNTLLIIEQPELHLHPMVQARLGDFFVGLSKCNKQCLIETHSENLISQLRYHIVQAGGQDKSDCMIYFVDQDAQGAAKFEPVEISPQGNILNWPDGFFDETMLQEDRITAASLKKRANKVKHG
jgi:hypothetical protein